ncbi:MAG: hypothetical protein WAX89_08200 [Alphaproteobacteria bacterium]
MAKPPYTLEVAESIVTFIIQDGSAQSLKNPGYLSHAWQDTVARLFNINEACDAIVLNEHGIRLTVTLKGLPRDSISVLSKEVDALLKRLPPEETDKRNLYRTGPIHVKPICEAILM